MNSTSKQNDTALVVVDMLNDFIDGTMACLNAREAVRETAAFIDSITADAGNDDEGIFGRFPVLFICDHHPADHCSFIENGGTWPAHCVRDTRGSAIHDLLMPYVSEELTFFKGCDRDKEQYSGWEGVNRAGQSLAEILDLLDIDEVVVCGIATEFCVKATAEDLLKSGKKVSVLEKALAYVSPDGHTAALEALRKEGIRIF